MLELLRELGKFAGLRWTRDHFSLNILLQGSISLQT